jgi:hypothetical protein
MRERDQGQGVILMLAAVAVVGMMIVAIGVVGRRLADHQQAQTAADAAALAGVLDGEPAARRVAEANGATLLGYEARGAADARTVTVTAAVGAQRATARATNGPAP